MHARVTRIRADASGLEAGADWFRSELLPQLERIPGYRETLLLIDRDHGEGLAITMWETAEAMAESERRADELRAAGAGAMPAEISSVERFQVSVQSSSVNASA